MDCVGAEIYRAMPTDSTQIAEEFYYHSENSCLGRFLYPNRENIQGIGLHSHYQCWDVEIILSGDGYRFCTPNQLEKISCGHILMNPPGKPHSILAEEGSNLVVYGYRCPPEYTGVELNPSVLSQGVSLTQAIDINQIEGTHVIEVPDYLCASIHKLHNGAKFNIPASENCERTLVLIQGEISMQQDSWSEVLKSGDSCLFKKCQNLCLSMLSDSMFIVFEPHKGVK